MNTKKVIKELKTLYSGKRIYVDKVDDTSEVLCELESTDNNPEKSVFVAVVDKRVNHYHRQTREVFEVIRGKLILSVDDREHTLVPGQSFTIKPGQVHSATGYNTWIKVTSTPGLDTADYVLVSGE